MKMLRQHDNVVLFVTSVTGQGKLSLVWAQTDVEGATEVENLMLEAEQELSHVAGVSPDSINLGDVFLAKFSEDGKWYRARVNSKSASNVKVCFIDYGNEEAVSTKDIAKAQPKYFVLPPQATAFILADIQPRNGFAWAAEELIQLSEQLVYRELPGQILSTGTVGNPPVIRLFEEAGSTTVVTEKILATGIGSVSDNSMTRQAGLERTILQPKQNYHVYVAFYESPLNFWLQLVENEGKIEALQAAIELEISSSSPGPQQVQPGTVCIAKYLDAASGTETFYRAVVTEVLPDGRVNVTYVDYGNKETVHLHEVKQIPKELMHLPAQAIQSCLQGVVADLSKFEQLMESENVYATVLSVMESGLHMVQLTQEVPKVSPPQSKPVKEVHPVQNMSSMTRVPTHYTPLQFNVGKFVDLCISHVESSGNFYCQLLENGPRVNQLMRSLEETYRAPVAPLQALAPEMPCVVRSVMDKGVFYRSQVINLLQGQVQVQHIDFGMVETVPVANVVRIDEVFMQTPAQAIYCCLSEAEKYDPLAVVKLLQRYESQTALVGGVMLKTGRLYEMELIDTSGVSDVKVISRLDTGSQDEAMNGLMEYSRPSLTKGEWEDVQVTSVEDPEHFYCQLLRDQASLDDLMAQIQTYCTSANRPSSIEAIGLGIPCLAKYQEDGLWYRASISGIMATGKVEVQFIDYGNRDDVSQDLLCSIPPEFMPLPVQAILCTLEGVFASSDSVWSDEEIDLFFKMVEENHPMMVVDYDDLMGRYSVELFTGSANINEKYGRTVGKLSARHTAPAPPPNSHRKTVAPAGSQKSTSSGESTTPERPQQQVSGWASWQQPQVSPAPLKPVELKKLDIDNGYKDVFIEFTVHPGEFYCSLETSADQLLEMMNSMNEEYSELPPHALQITALKPGQICCASYLDGKWYRAKVLGVAAGLAIVQYVDYGHTLSLDVKELRHLKERYAALPIQAIPCTMSGIAPVDTQWKPESTEKFQSLTTEKKLVCGFIGRQNDGVYQVELIETLPMGQKVINDELVRAGLATSIKPPEEVTPVVMRSSRQPARRASNSSTSSTSSSRSAVQDKYQYIALMAGQFVDVNVVHVESPSQFWCQLTQSSGDLEVLMDALHNDYSALAQGDLRLSVVRPDTVCCARFSEDKEWYRAEIISCVREEVIINYVDYGNSEQCPMTEVRALRPEHLQLPVQAILCTLDGITAPASGWNPGVKEQFEDLVLDKNLVAQVMAVLPNKTYKLSLVDKTEAGDLNIVSLLSTSDLNTADVATTSTTSVSPKVTPPAAKVEPVTHSVQAHPREGFLPPDIQVGQQLTVNIVWVESPKSFWCQPLSAQVPLETLMINIYEFYEKLRLKDEVLTTPTPGQACVAFYSEDGAWYRSLVLRTRNREAEVLYIDYGNKEKLSWSKLKKIQPQFLEAPQQAFRCCLDNVEVFGDNWTEDVFVYFQELMKQKVKCTVVSSDNSLFRVTITDASGRDANDFLAQVCNTKPARSGTEAPRQRPPPTSPPQQVMGTPPASPKQPPPATPPRQEMATPPRSPGQTGLVPLNTPLRPGAKTSFTVSNIEGVDLFYCQLTEKTAALDSFMETLLNHYASGKEPKLSLAQVKPGMTCAAQFIEDDYWYRATVTKILPDNRLEILYVDYGNSEVTTFDRTCHLLPQFLEYPVQAFKCRLAGVSGTSNPEVLLRFRQLVEEQPLTAVVKNRGEYIEVELFNTEMQVDVNEEIQKLIGSKPSVPGLREATAAEFPTTKVPTGEVGVYMTHVDTPSNFWVQKTSDESEVQAMADRLFEEYNSLATTESQLIAASVGTACMAKYSEDGAWYRATIEQINGTLVSVRFVDYGNTDTVAIAELKTISTDLLSIVPYSIHCRLYGVKEPEGGWKEDQVAVLEGLEMEVQATFIKDVDPAAVSLKQGGVDVAEHIGTFTPEVEMKSDLPVGGYPLPAVPDQAVGFVSHAENPGCFYIQVADQIGKLESVTEDLQNSCSAPGAEDHRLSPATKGAACCAKFSEDDAWYRATVEKVEDQNVTVHFVDFGNYGETIKAGLLQPPENLLKTPLLAFECQLEGIAQPSSGWPEGITERFDELTVGKDLAVLFKTHSPPYVVHLTLEEDVAEVLIREFPSVSQEDVKTVSLPTASDTTGMREVIYEEQVIPPQASVVASHVESPSEFYVQLTSMTQELEGVMDSLCARYKTLDAEMERLFRPSIGQACCVKSPEDQLRYRAIVIAILDDNVTVRLVDYGITKTLASQDLKMLHADLAKKPCYAIKCFLSGATPDPQWSRTEILKFQSMVADKQGLSCRFLTSTQPCEVFLQCEDININTALIPVEDTESESEGFETPQEAVSDAETEVIASLPAVTPPAKGEVVYVSVVKTPGLFYLQRGSTEATLDELSELIKVAYSNQQSPMPTPEPGQLCCARFAEDGLWYRACIKELGKESATVHFVDYGNTESVILSDILPLPASLRQQAAFAIPCCLDAFTADTQWTDEQIAQFTELTMDKELTVRVLNKTQPYYVTLMDNGVDIGQALGVQPEDMKSKDEAVAPVLLPEAVSTGDTSDKDSDSDGSEEFTDALESVEDKADKDKHASAADPDVLLSVGQREEVYVSHANSPSQFWCQLDQCKDKLDIVMDGLAEVCASGDDQVDISPGLLCAARYSDGEWYRATILSVIDDQVEVFFVDFGNSDKVYQTDLHSLPVSLSSMEPQALECVLDTVQAASETWSDQAIVHFHELTEDKKLLAEVTLVAASEDSEGKLTHCYAVKLLDMGISIAEKLLKAGHAIDSAVPAYPSSKAAPKAVVGAVPTSPEKADFYTSQDLDQAKETLFFAAEEQGDSEIVSLPVNRLNVGQKAEVYISHAETLGRLWVQLKAQEAILETIVEEMQESYGQNTSDVDETFQDTIQPELICAAHSVENDSWFRCRIVVKRIDEAEVFYVDYGNTETLTLDRIQPLKPKFHTQAEQALKCSLRSAVTWSDNAVEIFINNTVDKVLVAETLSIDGDSYGVKLLDMGTCVLRQLVEAGAEIDMQEAQLQQEEDEEEDEVEVEQAKESDNTKETFTLNAEQPADGPETMDQVSEEPDSDKQLEYMPEDEVALEEAQKEVTLTTELDLDDQQDLLSEVSRLVDIVSSAKDSVSADNVCDDAEHVEQEKEDTELVDIDSSSSLKHAVSTDKVCNDAEYVEQEKEETELVDIGSSSSFKDSVSTDKVCNDADYVEQEKEASEPLDTVRVEYSGVEVIQENLNVEEAEEKITPEIHQNVQEILPQVELEVSRPKEETTEEEDYSREQVLESQKDDPSLNATEEEDYSREQVLESQKDDPSLNATEEEDYSREQVLESQKDDPLNATEEEDYSREQVLESQKDDPSLNATEEEDYSREQVLESQKDDPSLNATEEEDYSREQVLESQKDDPSLNATEEEDYSREQVLESQKDDPSLNEDSHKAEESNLEQVVGQIITEAKAQTQNVEPCDTGSTGSAADTEEEDNLLIKTKNVTQENELGTFEAPVKLEGISQVDESNDLGTGHVAFDGLNEDREIGTVSSESGLTLSQEIAELETKPSLPESVEASPSEEEKEHEDADIIEETSTVPKEEEEDTESESECPQSVESPGSGEAEQGTSELDSSIDLKYQRPSFHQGQHLEVNTSTVTSPSAFWCQLIKPSTTDLPLLSDCIQDQYSPETDQMILSDVKHSLPCIAKCSIDGNWYRGLVTAVYSDDVEVHFVDYGNAELLKRAELRAMQPELMELDAQAFKCRLAGVRPVGDATQWDETSSARFEELVTDKDLVLIVGLIHEEAEGISSVEVNLRDADISIAQLMIEGGYAQSDSSVHAVPVKGSVETCTEGEEENLSDEPEEHDEETWHLQLTFDPTTVLSSVLYLSGTSPDSFVCQLEDSAKELERQLSEAAQQSTVSVEDSESLQIGSAVLVSHQDDTWHRGLVISIEESVCEVELVDLGYRESVACSQLYPLDMESRRLPPQVVKCCLAGIETEEWTEEASKMFEELCRAGQLSASVVDVQEDNVHNVYLYNVSDPSGQSINFQLISKGFAWVSVNSELIEMTVPHTNNILEPPQDLEISFLEISMRRTNSVGSLGEGQDPEESADSTEDAMEFANQIFSSGEVLSVTLVSASDPDNLVCHATATEKDLQMVMDDLAKTYSSVDEPSLPELRSGEACVAKCSRDGRWHRCKTLAQDETGINVLYVDYGKTETVTMSNIREMLPSFLDLPIQAIHCSLDDLQPVSETWASEAGDFLVKICERSAESLKATIVTVEEDGKLLVDLKTSDSQDLAEALIAEGLAASSQTGLPTPADREVKELQDDAGIVTDLCLVRPQVGDCLGVTLAHVVNLGHFWCQTDSDQLGKLMNDMQDFYHDADHYMFEDEPREGGICVNRGQEDNRWYRSRIQSIYSGVLTLVHVDDGTVETVNLDAVKPLSTCFAQPPFAFPCSLSRLLPPIMAAMSNEAATARLEELRGESLQLEVLECHPDGVADVSLMLTSTGQNVIDLLVESRPTQMKGETSEKTASADEESADVANPTSLVAEEE